jgi:hypothetical protein
MSDHETAYPRSRGNGAGLNVQANFSHGLVSDMVPSVSPGRHA